MKKIIFFSFAFLLTWIVSAQDCATDLIISEYGEGSSGYSKYIEIYNGTGVDVDLTQYQLWRVSNGGTWPEATYNFTTTTLPNNSTIVIANNDTDTPGADEYDSGFASWNGDDAVGLAKDDGTGTFILIDAVGTDGDDPGSGWDVAGITTATKDHYLVRKSSVTSPNTDWDASRGTTADDSEWEVYTYETGAAQAGHTMTCSTTNINVVNSDIEIFPNPVKNGTIYINNYTGEKLNVNIYSIDGKNIFSGNFDVKNIEIPINERNTLIYVKIQSQSNTLVKKLIVK